jgi:hypothetical protein
MPFKGRFPLAGIFHAERNFSLSFLISSTQEITRQREIPLSAENSFRTISTQEKFPRTENFPKISLLKFEHFQLQNFFTSKFFPTENLCRPITFYNILFLRKIFLSGNGPLGETFFIYWFTDLTCLFKNRSVGRKFF